jgi:hypothetical protein
MKKTIKMAVIGALLAAGVSRASAQSNVWDQPVTFSFPVVLDNGLGFEHGTVSTRTIINLMSSQTITNFNEGVVTNTTVTNVTIVPVSTTTTPEFDVTNNTVFALSTNSSWFTTNLVAGGTNLVLTAFPTSITATNVVGLSNGVPFVTNSVTLSQSSTNPVTYTFVNQASSNTYYFTNIFAVTNASGTNIPASLISAVLLTNSNPSNLVFSFEFSSYSTNTSTVSITNPVVTTTPDFVHDKFASLHRLVTILNGSNQPATYSVRAGATLKTVVDYDVSGFFTKTSDSNTVTHTVGKTVTTYRLDDIYFVTPDGSKVRFAGEAKDVTGPLRAKGAQLSASILLGSTTTASTAGLLNSAELQIQDWPIVGSGTITVGPGTLRK